MKKLIVTLLTVLTLAFSANCFAAGVAGDFSKQEKAADLLVSALTGGTATYTQVSGNFNADLKKAFNEQTFAEMQKQVKAQVGRIKDATFVDYKKGFDLQKGYNGVSEMIYIGKVGGNKYAQINVLFGEEKGKPAIVNFVINPFEVNPQPAK